MNLDTETLNAISTLQKLHDSLLAKAVKVSETITLLKGDANMPLPSLNKVSDLKVEDAGLFKGIVLPPPVNHNKKTVVDRVIAIIKSQDRFLRRSTIMSIAEQLGTPFKGNVIAQMSSNKDKEGVDLAVIKLSTSDAVWGLKSWVGAEGNVLPEHISKFEKSA